jgi:hypothetical protein
VPVPALVLASAAKTDAGEDYLLLMDLGGEQPFDIWPAEQFFGRAALVLSAFRIEVDVATRSPALSAMHRNGHAFVSQQGRGLIGSSARERTSMRDAGAFTDMGERVIIAHDSNAFSFSRWRIVHGEPGAEVVIYEQGQDAGA